MSSRADHPRPHDRIWSIMARSLTLRGMFSSESIEPYLPSGTGIRWSKAWRFVKSPGHPNS